MGLFRRVARHPVTHNALGLYGVQIAGYVIPLVTLPYIARVLRPTEFGLLLFTQSFAQWAALTVEYGFNLSATRDIAQNKGQQDVLRGVAAGVLGAKSMLLAGLAVVSLLSATFVLNFREHPAYLWWALAQTLAMGFSPFWYFQGTERMVGCVSIELFSRAGAAGLMFVLVHAPHDGWKVMALQAAGGCTSTVVQTLWMYRDIGFRLPKWSESIKSLRSSWDMFLFRSAYNIYSSANAFILGLFVSPIYVGYFGGAQRIARAMQALTSPFAQAVYPRMSVLVSKDKTRAARMARVTVFLNACAGAVLSCGIVLFGRRLVALLLGPGYEPSLTVLYVFAIFLPINSTNLALIMHWMLPSGMEKLISRVTFGAIILNISLAAVLAPRYLHVGMAEVMLVAESCKLAVLATVLLRKSVAAAKTLPIPETSPAESV